MGPLKKLLVLLATGVMGVSWAGACGPGTNELGLPSQDGSAGAAVPDVNTCDALVARTCGVDDGGGPCAASAACTASTLTRQHTPDACVALQNDEANYPACANRAVQTCNDLLVKTCGAADGGACSGQDTCLAAQDVAGAENAALCREAQGDETSYPRCLP